tara:strand:- start:545 stop:775 length:231 start_codon:yes stop_codon:yes gene_type:complete
MNIIREKHVKTGKVIDPVVNNIPIKKKEPLNPPSTTPTLKETKTVKKAVTTKSKKVIPIKKTGSKKSEPVISGVIK